MHLHCRHFVDELLIACVQPEEIKASLENGVLTVTYPRTTPEQAPKKIAVQ